MALIKEFYAAFVFYHACIFDTILQAFPTTLIPQLKEEGYQIDTFTESLLGSIGAFVAGITSFFSIFLLGKTGRKRIFRLSLFVSSIGMIIVVFSPNVFAICCGLIISSLTTSFLTPTVPCYISEVCHKKRRGVLLTGIYIVGNFGSAFVFFTHAFLSWRVIAAVSLILFPLSGYLQSFFIPESKYWRLLEGNEYLARKSAKWFEARLDDGEIDTMIVDMKLSIANDPPRARISTLQFYKHFRRSAFVRPLLKGIILGFLRSGCGRPFLSVHFISVMQHLLIPYNLKTVTMLFAIVEVVGGMTSLTIIRWLRRKTAIYLSCIIMIVSLCTIISYKILLVNDILIPAWIAVMCLYMYGTVAKCGFNSLLFVISSEIQSPSTRAETNSLIGGFTACFFSLYVFIYPYVQLVVPIEYILCYCVVLIASSALFVHISFPETSEFEFYENEKNKNVDVKADEKG